MRRQLHSPPLIYGYVYRSSAVCKLILTSSKDVHMTRKDLCSDAKLHTSSRFYRLEGVIITYGLYD